MNSILISLAVAIPLIFSTPKIVEKPIPIIIKQIDKQDIVLSYYIEKLAKCESSNNPDAYLAKDSNGLSSHGYLQFQEATWKAGIKKYNLLPNVEENEYMNLINDKDTQIKLAKEMILNEKNGWKHWANCAKSVGLDKFNPKDFQVRNDSKLGKLK